MASSKKSLETHQPDLWKHIAWKSMDAVFTARLEVPILSEMPRSRQIEAILEAKIIEHNQGFREVFHRDSQSHIVGKSLKECFNFENSDRQYLVKRFLDEAFDIQGIRISEKIAEDSAVRHTINAWHGLSDDGALIEIVGCARENSDEVAMYRSLKRSEESLQMALDGASMGIFQWMSNGIFLDLRAAEILASPDSAYTIGFDGFNRLHPDDSTTLEETFSSCLQSLEPFSISFRILAPSGEIRWVEMCGHTSRESTLDCHFIGTVQDISARKRAERALQEAKEHAEGMNRVKTAFLANMSHEMRTPLNAIIGFAELMAEDTVAEEHREYLNMMVDSGQRLLTTINSVLDVSRIESGHVEIDLKPINLKSEIENLIALYRPQANKRRLYLEYHHNAPNFALHTDRSGLVQILQSLLDNAVKFTPQGGITIRSFQAHREGRDYVAVSIKDTGIGMDEAFAKVAFDPFKQESEGFQREYEGSGLGLSLVRKWTHLLQGSIDLRSKRGQGTEFFVYFPTTRNDSQNATPAPPRLVSFTNAEPQNEDTPTGSQVLIVEDDPINALLTERYLQKSYITDTANDSRDAIQKCQSKHYDIILMDIHLSDGQTGLDVLKKVRLSPMNSNTWVIATTAHAMSGDRERLLESGFDAYISKPFTRGELLSLLEARV